MVANTILLLKRIRRTSASGVYPYYLHGWIYHTLRDTKIGQYYHDTQNTPFAIKEIQLDGEVLSIQLIFLDYRIMVPFISSLYRGMRVRLGCDDYALEQAAVHHEDHPEAGIVSYESFYLLPVAERISMNFRFAAFSSQQKTSVLPVPKKLVRSLLFKWNETSPYKIEVGEGFVNSLASGMLITSHNIHTTLYHIRDDITLTTFSGRVVYQNLHKEQRMRQLLNLLIHFSHYSGVGWKCAYGMGRVDVSPVYSEVLIS